MMKKFKKAIDRFMFLITHLAGFFPYKKITNLFHNVGKSLLKLVDNVSLKWFSFYFDLNKTVFCIFCFYGWRKYLIFLTFSFFIGYHTEERNKAKKPTKISIFRSCLTNYEQIRNKKRSYGCQNVR